jgi:hypothetical protein
MSGSACIVTLLRFVNPILFLLLPLCAQPPQEAPKKGGGGPPKNLKLLKPEDLRAGVMRQFTEALSVRFDHCHVQGDNASDVNPKNNVSRMVISIVWDINAKFPDAKEHVITCYTCHGGKVRPVTVPPPAARRRENYSTRAGLLVFYPHAKTWCSDSSRFPRHYSPSGRHRRGQVHRLSEGSVRSGRSAPFSRTKRQIDAR